MPKTIFQVHPVIVYFYWGFVLTALFFGLTFAQACSYFRTYPDDRRLLKTLVVVVMLLCSAQFILEGNTIYGYVVRARGDLNAINNVPKVFRASMAGTGIIAFTVESIYAVRIYRLSDHNLRLTGIVVLLALFGAGGGIAMVVDVIRHPFWDDASTNTIPAAVCLSGTVFCDLSIAVIQVYLFRQHQSSNRSDQFRTLLKKLSTLVVSVGVLTTADALVFLISFVISPTNGFFIIPYLLLCNCYLNSFLSLLNKRSALRYLADNELTIFSRATTMRFHGVSTTAIASAEDGRITATLSSQSTARATLTRLETHLDDPASDANSHELMQRDIG